MAINYKIGDALEILPSQNPSAVDAFIERCNLDPDCYITVCNSIFFCIKYIVFFSLEHAGEPHIIILRSQEKV
jgi:sulfite reductase alpha subunit-like flavoprotein